MRVLTGDHVRALCWSWSLLAATFACQARCSAAEILVPDHFASIQSAIDSAVAGDSIVVRKGVYLETIDFKGKSITVRSLAGPAETIVDAEGRGSVVSFKSGEGLQARLEGFTLRGGVGTLFGLTAFGGGIVCSASSPTILNNVIDGNESDFGGGLAALSGAGPNVESNVFIRNVATAGTGMGDGGGVFCDAGSSIVLRRNVIESNRAGLRGGGVYCAPGASVAVLENSIVGNEFTTIGGQGGGIMCFDVAFALIEGNVLTSNLFGIVAVGQETGSVQIRRNRVVKNTGAGVTCAWVQNAVVEENVIARNENGVGGGLVIVECSPGVRRNVIRENRALVGAGVVICASGVMLDSNLIHDNRITRGTTEGPGTGVYMFRSDECLIRNCTISGNTNSAMWFQESDARVENSIIWGNTGPRDPIDVTTGPVTSDPIFENCIVEGGWKGRGSNNSDLDPLFVDAAGGDFHLRLGSPAVDAGLMTGASLDFERDPRSVDGDGDGLAAVDIGADELLRVIAACFGTTVGVDAGLFNALQVNSTEGNRRRRVKLSVGEPIAIEMLAPPNGPSPARFVLYAWLGEPDLSTVSVQPFGLGTSSFPTPLNGAMHPTRIWNNLGYPAVLGEADRPSDPAPSVVLNAPLGASASLEVTFQGFIEDAASHASHPVSLTNAVVLSIE